MPGGMIGFGQRVATVANSGLKEIADWESRKQMYEEQQKVSDSLANQEAIAGIISTVATTAGTALGAYGSLGTGAAGTSQATPSLGGKTTAQSIDSAIPKSYGSSMPAAASQPTVSSGQVNSLGMSEQAFINAFDGLNTFGHPSAPINVIEGGKMQWRRDSGKAVAKKIRDGYFAVGPEDALASGPYTADMGYAVFSNQQSADNYAAQINNIHPYAIDSGYFDGTEDK